MNTETSFQSRQAECAVIYHLATGNQQARIFSIVQQEDFASLDTKAMFARMVKAYGNGNPLRGDATVMNAVAPLIADMGDNMNNVQVACEAIALMAKRRMLAKLSEECQSLVSDFTISSVDLEAQVHRLSQTALAQRSCSDGTVTLGDAMKALITNMEQANAGNSTVIPTGLPFLDRFQVLEGGNLLVIGARPSVGKTAMAVSMTVGQIRRGLKVGFICLEMQEIEIARRFLSQTSGVGYADIRDRNFGGQESDFAAGMEEMKGWKNDGSLMLSVGDSTMTAPKACELIRRWVNENDVQVVYLDYLQRFQPVDPRETDVQTISKAAMAFKNVARELNITVVLLAQLNRDSESRTNMPARPRMRHLKGSSSIEQEADAIWLMFRPEREMDENANGDTAWPALREADGSTHVLGLGKAAIFADKNRNGDVWKARVDFIGPTMTYERDITGGY